MSISRVSTGRLVVAAMLLASLLTWGASGRAMAAGTLSVVVRGNHLVDAKGRNLHLVGVDVPSTEYACVEGWGDASLTASPAADAGVASSVASWDADAVRIPLNEDCWLGINGQPSYGTVTGYRKSIEDEVAAFRAVGVYSILDLHWSAPGTDVANGQQAMPDDHSIAFWKAVAKEFEADDWVLFDAFNEPVSPSEYGDPGVTVSWSCWERGGCAVPTYNGDSPDDADTYRAVGMQQLVDAIRSTGAGQPILLGGLAWANDLRGWLAHEPTDPDHALVASFHDYYGDPCDAVSCWNKEVAPVAAEVPVVTGELDQGFDCSGTPSAPAALVDFDRRFMGWADAHGVGYLAWGWWELSPDPGTTSCSSLPYSGSEEYALIDDSGHPVAPDGTNLYDHLRTLAASRAGGG